MEDEDKAAKTELIELKRQKALLIRERNELRKKLECDTIEVKPPAQPKTQVMISQPSEVPSTIPKENSSNDSKTAK